MLEPSIVKKVKTKSSDKLHMLQLTRLWEASRLLLWVPSFRPRYGQEWGRPLLGHFRPWGQPLPWDPNWVFSNSYKLRQFRSDSHVRGTHSFRCATNTSDTNSVRQLSIFGKGPIRLGPWLAGPRYRLPSVRRGSVGRVPTQSQTARAEINQIQ